MNRDDLVKIDEAMLRVGGRVTPVRVRRLKKMFVVAFQHELEEFEDDLMLARNMAAENGWYLSHCSKAVARNANVMTFSRNRPTATTHRGVRATGKRLSRFLRTAGYASGWELDNGITGGDREWDVLLRTIAQGTYENLRQLDRLSEENARKDAEKDAEIARLREELRRQRDERE